RHDRNIVVIGEESVSIEQLRSACPRSMKALFDYPILTVHHPSFEKDIETLAQRFIPPHKGPPDAGPHNFTADISRIDRYAPARLIGRDSELNVLSKAWQQAVRGQKSRPHL